MSNPESPSPSLSAEEQVKAIQARLAAISQTPWCLDERFPNKVYCDDVLGSIVADCDAEAFGTVLGEEREANADFVVNAPADLAFLLAERVSLLAAREAWEAFAWHLSGCVECGQTSYENCFDGKLLHDAAVGSGSPGVSR